MKVLKLLAWCIVQIGMFVSLLLLSPMLIYAASESYLEREKKRDMDSGSGKAEGKTSTGYASHMNQQSAHKVQQERGDQGVKP
jgi:hypothetical protein